MDDKLQVAINKLDTEAEASGIKGLKVVADLLIQHISLYPEDAEKITANGKKLYKAFEEVKQVAKQEAKGGCCYMAPERVMQMIFNYYDIDAVVSCRIVAEPANMAAKKAAPDIVQEQQPAPELKQEASVSINLDDFF